MIDTRFFTKKSFLTMKEICNIIKIDLPENIDPNQKISDLATLDKATDIDISFFHNSKYAENLCTTKAFACIIDKKNANLLTEKTIPLIVDEPYYSFALLLKEFYSIKTDRIDEETFISKKSSISKKAKIGNNVYISDNVVIADDCVIEDGVFIGANTTILNGVEIAENCHIESNVTIGFSLIGKNSYIKTGARIGQQGFGFHMGKSGLIDVMQIGKVIIGKNTQIGANCTIDRGSMSDTKIGSNVRIDDMVHIAHNVEIGNYCIIAAQTGIAGSVIIGNSCIFGGQTGVAGHLKIGNKVIAAAKTGIMRNVEDCQKIAGTPEVHIMNWHRQNVLLQKLVENRGSLPKKQKKGIVRRIREMMGG